MNYIKIYEQIINQAENQDRKKNINNVFEKHHIIPKSVNGGDYKDNLVLLTPKEHYICHKLLVEIYKGTKFERKMYYAMWCMINGNGNQKRFSSSSRIYENFKKEFIKQLPKERFDNRKIVLKYNLLGEFICEYDSVKSASKDTGISSSSIENCSLGKSKRGGDFIWKYKINDIINENIEPYKIKKTGRKNGCIPWNKGMKFDIKYNKKYKKIKQFSINGVFIKEWDCASLINKTLNISTDSISNCCNNKSKTAGGFIWKYSNNVIDDIKPIFYKKPGRKKGSIPWNKKSIDN